jgi:hypothetical protein
MTLSLRGIEHYAVQEGGITITDPGGKLLGHLIVVAVIPL